MIKINPVKELDYSNMRAEYIKLNIITPGIEEELVRAYFEPTDRMEYLPFTSVDIIKRRRATLIEQGLLVPREQRKMRH